MTVENKLLTPDTLRQYIILPATVGDALLADLIKQETSAMTLELGGYLIINGEGLVIDWTTLEPAGQDIYLPVMPQTITLVTEGLTNRVVSATEYIIKDTILTRVFGSGTSLNNYFDTLAGPYGLYWQPPVHITYVPRSEYADLVADVLIELVTIRLAKLGRLSTGVHPLVGLSGYRIGEQEVRYNGTQSINLEVSRRSAYKRLNRTQRLG